MPAPPRVLALAQPPPPEGANANEVLHNNDVGDPITSPSLTATDAAHQPPTPRTASQDVGTHRHGGLQKVTPIADDTEHQTTTLHATSRHVETHSLGGSHPANSASTDGGGPQDASVLPGSSRGGQCGRTSEALSAAEMLECVAAADALDWPARRALPDRSWNGLVRVALTPMCEYSDDIAPSTEWHVCDGVSGGDRPGPAESQHSPQPTQCTVCTDESVGHPKHGSSSSSSSGTNHGVSSLSARAAEYVLARPATAGLRRRPRAIDLFCGGGGSSIGLAAAGYDIVAGIDVSETALANFSLNHPGAKSILGDMYKPRDVLAQLKALGLDSADLITCSSPCPPFSTANMNRKVNDPRVQLTFNAVWLAAWLRPRSILFENVPGILRHDRGRTWRRCLKMLRAAGYKVKWNEVDSTTLVPQRRRRFIAMCTLGEMPDFDTELAELNARPVVTLADTFPHWRGQFYYHRTMTTGAKSIYALDQVSPPLRTNCGSMPSAGYVRTASDDGPPSELVRPSITELGQIMGWPTDAHLPGTHTAAGRILGNAVCPPVARWLGGLLLPTLCATSAVETRRVSFAPGVPAEVIVPRKPSPTSWHECEHGAVLLLGPDGPSTGHDHVRCDRPECRQAVMDLLSEYPAHVLRDMSSGDHEPPEPARRTVEPSPNSVVAARRARERATQVQAEIAAMCRGPTAHVPASVAVQRSLRQAEESDPGASLPLLPGTTDPQALEMDAAVPDPDVNVTAVHVAQLRRRERKRLALQIREKLFSDGTLRSLRDPIWSSPPLNAPPSSGNPAAMFGARPWRREDASSEPTHACNVSQHWRNWRVLHMSHCQRCQRHSLAVHGEEPPLAALRTAHSTGVTPDASTWTPDPECYQAAMVDDVRVGFQPPLKPTPAPREVPNGPSCWGEWPAMGDYMRKMDDVDAMGPGEWRRPADSVVSALHCVTRPSDMREFLLSGTPYPVRTVLDLTASGVNETLPDWKFRMEGIDAAVRLLGNRRFCYVGKTDLSKYFPSLPLHPSLQRYVMLKDPRVDTTWRGHGPPSAAWLADQQWRRRQGRTGPYKKHTGLPLGLKLAPAFASALSGEMMQFITSLGIDATMYVDDMICAADTEEECRAAMDTAISVFKWLGFRCNADKQEGPATCLEYLGYELDTERRTVTITDARRTELQQIANRLLQPTIGTKDLETILGKLGFAAGVILGGRTYLYRLHRALTGALRDDRSVVALGTDEHADASWWVNVLNSELSGSRIFLEDEQLPVITIKSDASGEVGRGWGYVHEGVLHWSRWDARTASERHMQYKELVALVHAAEEHGAQFANRVVRFGVDNTGVCFAVNRMSSRCPTVMRLLRRLADAQCTHNFQAVCVHVSRRFNDLSDLCSRFQVLSEFNDHLPSGITTAGEAAVRVCRNVSPADSAPVFAVRLTSRGELESTRALTPRTPSTSSTSTNFVTPTTPTPRSAMTTSSCSSSGTSPASAPRSCALTRLCPSTSQHGQTTAPSTASTSRTRAPSLGAASRSSWTASPTGSRTCPSAPLRCASLSSPTLPLRFTSPPPPHCGAAASGTSHSGRASSPRTTPASVQSSTVKGVASATSPTAAATSDSGLGTERTSRSTSTGLASPCFQSRSRTCPPATSCASSDCASTPSPKRSAGGDPVLFRSGPRTRAAEPWSAAFKRLKSLAAEAGVNVATGRCLRAGGATDLFANGAPEWFVKQQGGWRSNAVERYNRPTTGQRAKVATVYTAKILAAAVAASESFITD